MDQKDHYMKDLFYESGADVTLKFKDGEKISVNRSLLAAKHEVFYKLLFADRSSEAIEISDFNAELFKLFLDCLIGFTELSKKNILQVFPVAVKYGIEEIITQRLEFLQSEEISEDLCLSFNSIVSHKMEHLMKSFVEAITKDARAYKLLEQDDLCHLLEPGSMLLLLSLIVIDSWVYDILFRWGRNYVKNNKAVNLKSFFHKKGFSSIIDLANFETIESVLEFHKSELGKDYFTDKEILDHIKKTHFKNICNSHWVKVKSGDFIEEIFHFENLFLDKDSSFQLNILRNNVVFYEWPINEICPIHYVLYWESYKLSEKLVPNICLKIFHEDQDENGISKNIQVAMKNFGEEGFVLNKIKIKYLFQADCRILKTTPKFSLRLRYEGDKENLCFTNDIFFRYNGALPPLMVPNNAPNNPAPKKKKSRSRKKKKTLLDG